ncbi:interleukin-1 receptor type 2-like [Hyla sarda]|uniref:interleukin-1 receptor type 2-like n=1 Tax=Hyla sarda TaxID=327740 RepID=UPI0024C46151|nr:interleukin-1 receptor type 2-like [Hyla sarda]
MKMCVLCILYICTILNFRDTASRSMAPRITEPLKNINLQVEAGSSIDLCCSALLESEGSVNATIIYWLINGSFIENISSIHEGSQRVSKKGDQNYVYIILRINDVIPELYNIPITCIANSPWGGDNSTLYLRAVKTGSSKWKVIIPITLLCLLVLALLVAFIYKYLLP